MAQQRILWTVLPHGRVKAGEFAGRLRVSIVVSPRLTPGAANEQVVKAFPEWRDWPKTLESAKFGLKIGATTLELKPISKADSGVWTQLLTDETPVAGFVFTDMSAVNLRSFSVRNVLGLLRASYGALAVDAAGSHPTLLPWKNAHPTLKGILSQMGTETTTIRLADRAIEVLVPGFDRFLDEQGGAVLDRQLRATVFGPNSVIDLPAAAPKGDGKGNPQNGATFKARALPPDWAPPAGDLAPAMSQFKSQAEYALFQADRFYRREPLTTARIAELKAQGQLRRPRNIGVPASPELPDWDFHRIIASYSDYPQLLRALGLIIDCVLPPNSAIDQQVNAAPQAQGTFGLEISWSNGHPAADDSCPQTAWRADKQRFVTRERTGDHERGLLNLESADDRWNEAKKSNFDVYQVDPDGAALKTVDFLLSSQRLVGKSLALGKPGDVTYTTGNEQPVAALRSGGLGISRHGRAQVIAQSAASAALKNATMGTAAAAKTTVLFAEDVLRGYRVDVQAMPGGKPDKWRSLCQRKGVYRYTGGVATLDFAPDEGYVKGASTTSSVSDHTDPEDHYLHESMFRWSGWSLVTQRPGRTLRSQTDSSTGVQAERPEEVTDEATDGGNGLSVSFSTPKGSLPKLRFGVPYRLRARITDLAGNSLDLDDASLETGANATLPVTYWRFEPVDPPALVHRARVSEGESLERMVIRSNYNIDPAGYLTTVGFAAARALPASADFDYTAVNERHVVPPKSSQLQCEQHGLFDARFGNLANIKLAYEVAAREAGTLYDALPSAQIELITPGALAKVATTTAVPPRLPSPANPTGDRLAAGQYVIHREALVETPYLPDGASGGIAIRGIPGYPIPGVTEPKVLGPSAMIETAPNQELVLKVTHGNDWPKSSGCRIILAELKTILTDPPCSETPASSGVPVWNESERTLTLFLQKGHVARLRYASFIDKRFLDTFGLPSWVHAPDQAEFVREMAHLGCNWMVTPYRSLVLVHATQQPVCEPAFLSLSTQREIGDQHALLISRLLMHGPSTGKFEIEAQWQEWVDDLDQRGPQLIDSNGQLGEIQLRENHENRFSLGPTVDEQQAPEAAQSRARADRHEFGDTKFRLIHYTIRATTRFREYLPEALYVQRDQVTRVGPIAQGLLVQVGADTDPGAPVLVQASGGAPNTVVLSSAPPDEPRVLYSVPTFRWTRALGSNSLDATRYGNGVRVWLERPWFSSGNGELLGVIILGDNRAFTEISSVLVPLVTQWGLDPLWETALPKSHTRVTDFAARVISEPVALRELPMQNVTVVGHRVRWDADRQLWYCDIDLDPGASYMPFVRFALVRYQPNALPDAKISKVVLAEFSQVLPRRRANFSRSGATVSFSLRGTVPTHGPMMFPLDSEYQNIAIIPPAGAAVESGRNKAELVLQTRDPKIDSDLAWSDVAMLGSSLLPMPSAPSATAQVPNPRIFQSAATRTTKESAVKETLGRKVELATTVDLGTAQAGRITSDYAAAAGTAAQLGKVDFNDGVVVTTADPAIWQTTVTLPDVGDKPARLVIREYERYYTDRTVPETRAGAVRSRRVVEERLVYTAFFDLSGAPSAVI